MKSLCYKLGSLSILTALVMLATVAGLYAQSPYAGTERCNDCHGDESNVLPGSNPWEDWLETRHAQIYRDPDVPATGQATGVVPDADFKAGLDLGTTPGFAQFGTNAPILGYDPSVGTAPDDTTSGYTVTVGPITYTVHRAHGGTGEWKQRFHTKIGKSYYILPIQYNEITEEWVPYNPQNWYDFNLNEPLYINPATLEQDIDKSQSEDRKCIGCHGTGVDPQFDETTGEWTGNPVEWNIGCETCHGPGGPPSHTNFGLSGLGVNPADLESLQRQLEACGQCHVRGSSPVTLGSSTSPLLYPFKEDVGPYRPGEDLLDFYVFVNPTNNVGSFWPDALPYGNTSKSHHQQMIDFTKSAHGMFDPSRPFVDLTCFTCHTPHKRTANDHQVRESLEVDETTIATSNDDNTLCLACHATFEPFENITLEMVQDPTGANLDIIAAEVSAHSNHSYDPTGELGVSRCSSCHMPKVQKSAINYDISAHTFWVMSPEQTKFFAPEGGTPNACAVSCHMQEGLTFGVDFSADVLTNWTEMTDLALADTLLRYYGPGGIWWDTGFPLTVEEIPDGQLPQNYVLSQNYPNPFNPTTKIEFDVRESGFVKLKVYNMLGQEVANLVNKPLATGRYSVDFNGSNLASGVYIYRMEVNGFAQSKKMILTK